MSVLFRGRRPGAAVVGPAAPLQVRRVYKSVMMMMLMMNHDDDDDVNAAPLQVRRVDPRQLRAVVQRGV